MSQMAATISADFQRFSIRQGLIGAATLFGEVMVRRGCHHRRTK